MFLSYFLSHFTTLNLLFCNLYLIMLMSEINVDTLQLSVVFQSLTLSALFPICGFVNFFSKYKLFFFFLQRRCVSFCWVPEAWPTLTSTDNSIFHLRFFKPPIQCETTHTMWTHHTMWVQATNLCEGIEVYDLLRENISPPFRIKDWDSQYSSLSSWAYFYAILTLRG